MDSVKTTTTRDNLIADDYPCQKDAITIAASQTLARGAIIGRVDVEAGTAAADAGNTGDGAISAFALASGGPAKVGDYLATCVEAITNSGRFVVTDPDGAIVGELIVAVSGNTTFTGAGITFNIADGAADFAVGDFFTLPVEVGSLQGKIITAAATDGSNKFHGVLLEAVTTGAAETQVAPIAISGAFQDQALSVGAGVTVAGLKDEARLKNCYIISTDADTNVVGG